MVLQYVGLIVLWIGVMFSTVGIIGMLRFPDVYTRLHASSKVATLGIVFLLLGMICFMPGLILKAIVLAGFLILTAPVASHAIASAAHRSLGRLPADQRDDLADEDGRVNFRKLRNRQR
ncbi:MAG: monovalent cation/H(+) antiporter subunit G [Anaerolineae bacterium]|jgi:multicomponent Na+:H+ antiporter subunit G|nr:monovalent cation/H(+) antiporter subunit G [Anaerolineae bacterium]